MPLVLLERCVAAHSRGVDFPTVWHVILRVDPLVDGAVIQMTDGEREWLEVPLTTGQRIALDHQTGYRLMSSVEVVLRRSVSGR